MVLVVLGAVWALLLGIALLKLSMGLHASLLGLRATLEGFSAGSTGFLMSAYFVGFLVSSIVTPKLIMRVGHVRVFAALASLASVAVLMHSIFINAVAWGFFRLITGFCYAGLYMVAESWLNDKAENETRGRILSIYMMVQFVGMAGGQLLLNVADPEGFELFVLVSALVSLALVPILLSVAPAPHYAMTSHVGLKSLFSFAPIGVAGAFGSGLANGALLAMGSFYAAKVGFSIVETSLFMGAVIIGGGILQWPIGRLSDHIQRRTVITTTTLLAALTASIATMVSGTPGPLLFALVALYGGLSLPLYSLCLATTNDGLRKEQMVAAGSALILVSGVGAVLGPVVVAQFMTFMGPNGFFWFFAVVHGGVGLIAVVRMTVKEPFPLEQQTEYQPIPPRGTHMATVLAAQDK
ncbi:MAG: MFS transporter [Magnetococcales bacterium]|nr:MFS transporter [Magnetococcales bacterium]